MLNSGYAFLFIIYLVWGTTYLAMRVGVGPGGGFPVFAFGAARCLAAAILLLAIAGARRARIKPTSRELTQLATTGIGMWVLSHGLVLWAEQYIASGFAALSVATAPIWVVFLKAMMHRTRVDLPHLVFAGIGFTGILVLMVPELRQPSRQGLLSLLFLVVSPMIWAYCALYVQRHTLRLSIFTTSAYQHLFGGLGFLALSWSFREPLPSPSPGSWGALVYLIVFGSVIAFTSYIKALSLLPAQLVMTNTFVNPLIAVLAGWLILGEKISYGTVIAVALVIFSVYRTLQEGKSRRVSNN